MGNPPFMVEEVVPGIVGISDHSEHGFRPEILRAERYLPGCLRARPIDPKLHRPFLQQTYRAVESTGDYLAVNVCDLISGPESRFLCRTAWRHRLDHQWHGSRVHQLQPAAAAFGEWT